MRRTAFYKTARVFVRKSAHSVKFRSAVVRDAASDVIRGKGFWEKWGC